MKIRFILNPRSGKPGQQARLRSLVESAVSSAPAGSALVVTEAPGHAVELAREAAAVGCTRVVAVGGDGTVNEVAQGLLRSPAALALVPAGSGNGLARHLGLSVNPAEAVKLALDPSPRTVPIDAGLANGHPFFNVMGLGMDAEVSVRFNRGRRRGSAAYLGATIGAYLHSRPESLTIESEGRRETSELLWIAVANSDQYGNGAVVAPGARCDDGLLDLIAVGPVGWAGAAGLAARIFRGTFDRSPAVRRHRGASFTVERPKPGLIHTDGELHQTGARIEIRVLPASLRIVAGRNGVHAR